MFGARTNGDGGSDGIISLVQETAEGFGQLIADHIKLARVEMVADAKEYGRHLGFLGLGAILLLVGYAFAWLAAVLVLGRHLSLPGAFLLVGGVHLLAGAAGIAVARTKLRGVRVMDDTVAEVGRSVATIAAEAGVTRPDRVPAGS
jgi:hypothetical protein